MPLRVGQLVGERGEDEPERRKRHRPPDQPGPRQPEREREWRPEPGRRPRLSRAGRDKTGTEVAASRQHEPGSGGRRRQAHRQQEWPPASVDVGAGLVRPGQRREPRQWAAVVGHHVTGGPHHPGRAEHRARHAGGRSGVLGDLDGECGDAGEDQADCSDTRAEQQPIAALVAPGDHGAAQQQGQHQVRAQRDHERGGELRETPHHAGADQLCPAVLLVDPSVPRHQQQTHQGGQHEEDHAVHAGDVQLGGDVLAAVAGPEHRAEPTLHEPPDVIQILLGLQHGGRHRHQVGQQHGDAQQQTGSLIRSRRRMNRISVPVPARTSPPAGPDGAWVGCRTAVVVIAAPRRRCQPWSGRRRSGAT